MVTRRRLLSAGALLALFSTTPAVFAEDAVIGKVRTDQTVYLQNGKMTIVHEVQNGSNESVSYADVNKRTFSYSIAPMFPTANPTLYSRSGALQETGAQYVAPGQTDSFAAGAVSLKDLPPGLYRLWINAPSFKGLSSLQNKYVGAGTAFRIAPTSEAGTISP